MRVTIHLVAILLAALGLGCATTVDVVFDEREDFSPYHTWDWLPHPRPIVDAPDGAAAALDARLVRIIERQLIEKGFERSGNRPDFFVTYQLALRHRTKVVDQARAPYELYSHHSDGSFLVESSERVARDYTEIQLAISVTEAGGRALWHAKLMHLAEDVFALELDDAVAALLERFPGHRQRGPAAMAPGVSPHFSPRLYCGRASPHSDVRFRGSAPRPRRTAQYASGAGPRNLTPEHESARPRYEAW